ncbi:MAG TPA: hypothetical protein VK963_02345 [Candidatus Saccharimonadales bacterium]|nr:hypothetical protein [Candidatus Saccharimonadales bacterium]
MAVGWLYGGGYYLKLEGNSITSRTTGVIFRNNVFGPLDPAPSA